MLPEIRNVKPLAYFTPTKWQTLLLRNFGLVPLSRLAETLATDEATVLREAERLGIEKISYDPNWDKFGYINIIKNNWHLVPYSQLLTLLNMDEATLDYCLKEDDFLGIKLGFFKAQADPVLYTPLTEEEEKASARLRELIKAEFLEGYAAPFDFYPGEAPAQAEPHEDAFDKIVYSYAMLYGDTLLDGEDIVPDDLLARLQSVGVNGLWMQGVLSKLSPYPFVKGLDKGKMQAVRHRHLSLFQ